MPTSTWSITWSSSFDAVGNVGLESPGWTRGDTEYAELQSGRVSDGAGAGNGRGDDLGLHEHVAPTESGSVPGVRAFRACEESWVCLDG